jgi:hypothetical protein
VFGEAVEHRLPDDPRANAMDDKQRAMRPAIQHNNIMTPAPAKPYLACHPWRTKGAIEGRRVEWVKCEVRLTQGCLTCLPHQRQPCRQADAHTSTHTQLVNDKAIHTFTNTYASFRKKCNQAMMKSYIHTRTRKIQYILIRITQLLSRPRNAATHLDTQRQRDY